MSNDTRRTFDVTPRSGHSTAFKSVEKRTRLSAPKVKKWSHQDELESLKGKTIKLGFLQTGGKQEFLLVEADQFTVKVTHEGETYVFFKHNLTGYQVI